MLKTAKHTLLIGIGNYGRSDDALGWNFIDTFASHDDLFDIEYRYQLQVEDSELISRYEHVIFVDATQATMEDGFSFYKCVPQNTSAFTTHKLEPEMVLWLAQELYSKQPEAHVLAIRGESWELHHGLSEQARENFNKAVAFFMAHINSMELSPAAL